MPVTPITAGHKIGTIEMVTCMAIKEAKRYVPSDKSIISPWHLRLIGNPLEHL